MDVSHSPSFTSTQSDRYPMKGGVSPHRRLRDAGDIRAAGASGTGTEPAFTYNGGPVIETPQVFAMFIGDWSSQAAQTRMTNLKQFLTDWLSSAYMNVLSQYGIGTSGTLVKSVSIASTDHDLSAGDIHNIIQNAINNGDVPEAGPSNAYVLLLDDATGVNDTAAGATMCEASSDNAFGFHDFFRTTAGFTCYFAVVPGLTDTCLKRSCSSDSTCSLRLSETQEERQTQVLSHELSEMFTDPEVGLNEAWTQPGDPHENGDICNGNSATLTVGPRNWTVQTMYSKQEDMNGGTKCVLSRSNPLPSFLRWRHLGRIHGHPLAADFDCSGLQQGVRSVTLADVNGDGRAEVIAQIDATLSGRNDFWAMTFDPRSGSWRHLSQIPNHPLEADFDCSGLSNAARAVAAGDVDGDGRSEVVIQIDAAGSGGNDFWVMKFAPVSAAPVWTHLSPIPGHPLQADFDCSSLQNAVRAFSLGDVDGDGHAEVVAQIDAANSGGNDFWVMKFDTSTRKWNHLSPIQGHALQADFDCSSLPQAARRFAAGDVDGDGRAEVVLQIDAANSGGNDFWVMKYDPRGRRWFHLSPIPGHPLQADFDCSGLPNAARNMVLADVDGDGRAEVVVHIDAAGSGGNDFWVMKFSAAGAAPVWTHLSPIQGHALQADFDCSGLPQAARTVSAGDVDKNGRAEVVLGIDASGAQGNTFWVMAFNPATKSWAHFSPIPGHPVEADVASAGLPHRARASALADVDGDGRAEIVVQIDAAGSGANDFWVMHTI